MTGPLPQQIQPVALADATFTVGSVSTQALTAHAVPHRGQSGNLALGNHAHSAMAAD